MVKVICAGSRTFPTNYDGTTTTCIECGRTLRLNIGGLVPNHSKTSKKSTPKLLPRGEAIIDGRRVGG